MSTAVVTEDRPAKLHKSRWKICQIPGQCSIFFEDKIFLLRVWC